MTDSKLPTFEEVYKYASKQLDVQINKIASTLPAEQKDEVRQEASIRVWQAYQKIEPDKGWRSFIQLHVRGAILDYIRWGKGFEESELVKKAVDPDEEAEPIKPWRLRRRVSQTTEPDNERTFDDFLGILGLSCVMDDPFAERPNWDLISRMSSQDQDIHLVAKLMIGFTHEEVAKMWRVSRERITQRLAEFCDRLDSAEYLGSRWTAQTIFAFGLCTKFHQKRQDLGFGWEYDPINLYSEDLDYLDQINPQLTFEFIYN